jgi:hypothetical protein
MNTNSRWRQIQLDAQDNKFIIPQEKRLLDFVLDNKISSILSSR